MILPKGFLFSIAILVASSAAAENVHDAPVKAAISKRGKPHLYRVDLPTCALDFHAFLEDMNADDMLLKTTSGVDLANGYFRGTLDLRLPDGHEWGSGDYLVTVECGAGLGRMLVKQI